MTTLLQINNELVAFRQLLESSIDEGGEINPESEAALTEWFAELDRDSNAKADAYCAVIREFQLRAEARKAEADRLRARAAVDENAARRLKERLMWFMQTNGMKRMETDRYKITVALNGGRLGLDYNLPPEELPPQYQRHKIEYDADAIHAALAAGEDVPGVRLKQRECHLKIS